MRSSWKVCRSEMMPTSEVSYFSNSAPASPKVRASSTLGRTRVRTWRSLSLMPSGTSMKVRCMSIA